MKMLLARRTTFTLLLAMTWLLLLSNAFSVAQDDALEGMATAPDPPVLLTPAEGELTTGATHPPLGVPMLTWQSVISATTYEVQVSASSGFATTLARAETSATSYVPIIAFGDGIFYWRVRARAGYLWGEYSDVSSFTVSWGNNDAIYPVLLAPEDEAVLTAFAHTHFSWQPVVGSASYQLRIATDPQMTTAVYTALTTKPHHTPLQRLGNNLYYWQVTPVNNSGHVGVASPIWRFTFDWSSAPQLLLPEDHRETPFAPRLSWTAVEGAKEYRLQISSQENFSNFDQIVTRNTDHTPVKALNNDAEYFWRVQAVDARSTASPWSQIWRFRMKWNLKPQLLSPTNSTIRLAYPFFAWAPVPGAEQYWIQIADNLGFNTPIVDTKIVNSTNHTQPEWKSPFSDRAYYWRVGAIDAQGNLSPWSDVWSFQFSDPSGLLGGERNATAPNLVYPPPYYAADAIHTPVHSDRSIGAPFFIWDVAHVARALDAPNLVEPADLYKLEVSDDPAFTSLNFTILTAGTSAAPTAANPFVDLQDGALYFWRVTAYRGEQEFGSRLTAQTRYSSALAAAAPAQTAIPEPIYPDDGFEAVGHPPLLGWQPVTGAAGYHVQLARDATFGIVDDQALAQFPHYTPWQGQLTPMPFGAYWWRVQAVDSANAPIGDWSAARYFHLSVAIAIGNPYEYVAPDNLAADTTGRALVAKSPEQEQGSYELRNLYTIVDRREGAPFNLNQNWVIAFTTGATSTDTIRYALYLDTDHVDGSGAAYDPLGNTAIVMDSRYRPEYVVYIDLVENVGVAALFYVWDGANWQPGVTLANIGGLVEFDDGLQSMQVFIPYTALGSANDSWVGSLAISAYSLDGNAVRDSVPLQGAISDNPVFVSNMLLPLFPFDTPSLNPTVYDDLPPMRWQMPAYGADGYQVQVALDSQFTQIVETWESYETVKTQLFTLIPTAFQSREAYANNESYYWRVRARHEVYLGTSYDYGPWSPAMRFKLDSRRVGSPRLSTGDNAFMTPTFLWDRVEGASGYTIQVDDDANFSSPLINQATDATSFTPLDTSSTTVLLPGVQYYWRVVMRRTRDIIGHWSDPMTFTKTSASPQPVAPLTGAMLNQQPTLQWTAVLTPSAQPRLAAPAYRVQIADNSAFNPIELDETTQSTSYTPPNRKLLADGVWYWRVAFVDGAGKLHPFSPAQSFTKEYLLPVLIEPGQGETTGIAPALTWGPIDGAAKYKLEYADNSGYNKSTTVTTELTRYVPTKAMTNSPYFWRVQMIDADGNPGPVIEGRFMFGFKVFLSSIQSE